MSGKDTGGSSISSKDTSQAPSKASTSVNAKIPSKLPDSANQDPSNVPAKIDAKDGSKSPKNASQDPSKVSTKSDPNKSSKSASQDPSSVSTKSDPNKSSKSASEDPSKASTRGDPDKSSKSASQDPSRVSTKSDPNKSSKNASQDPSKASTRGDSSKSPKGASQDSSKVSAKVDSSKTSKNENQDANKEPSKTNKKDKKSVKLKKEADSKDKESKRTKKRRGLANLNISFTKIEDSARRRDEEKGEKKVVIANDDEQSRVLASFVPDEIIYDYETCGIRVYDVALLLGDVSGFTDLCEKYNKTGRGGPSRLTEILNGYIGSMVQEIMSGQGDVLNFSGDAFLAWWKTSPEKSMQDVVGLAIDCAVMIQKNYGTYDTDVGVTLRVKVGIAAGTILFSVIGTEKLKYFIIVGRPIFDVKLSEHLCTKGDVMVSPRAWKYIPENAYIYDTMPDGLHKKIKGAAEWKRMQMGGFGNLDQSMRDSSEPELARFSASRTEFSEQGRTYRADDYLLRPSVNEAARQVMKEPLRPYIFPPVMKGIDMNEPLEYLTEMRHVVIMFVNVITASPDMYRLVSLVDEAYCTVCKFVEEYRGSVNKCSMFDKDLMFLVVYGLRGYKHDLESQSGLRCAAEVYRALVNIQDIVVVSIGVTTGMTYCGAVGHALRREYTVIGAPVNKAARLMIAYPSRVTCDRETFLQSQLDARHFSLQEAKELKGLGAVGPIYEYMPAAKPRSREKHIVCKYPLLDRDREMQIFHNHINRLTSHASLVGETSSRTRRQMVPVTALVIQGLPRQGKSRLLDEMAYSTDPNTIQIHRVALSYLDKRVPYTCIQLIFAPALGFPENASMRDKEEILANRLKGNVDPELLCCLNFIFNVSFFASEAYFGRPVDKQEKILTTVFKRLVEKCFADRMWAIAIDDSENIDDDSWGLLQVIIEVECIFLIMTLGLRREITETAQTLLQSKRVRKLILEPIDKVYHTGLACQMLEVKAIPPELEKEIHDQSHGSPGWIESYLVSLLQAGGIEMTSVPRNMVNDMGLVVAELAYVTRREQHSEPGKVQARARADSNLDVIIASDDSGDDRKDDGWGMYRLTYDDSMLRMIARRRKAQEARKEGKREQTVEVVVCTLTPNFNTSSLTAELTMDVMVIKIFDSLTSFQQMVLKYAAVLGEVFTRKMLKALLVETDNWSLAVGIKHLFEIQVLGCAGGDFINAPTFMSQQRRLVDPGMDQPIQCTCKGIFISSSCKNLPEYASCGYMRFRMPVFKDTVYHLLTNMQKKDAHMRVAKYLGRETRRCQACGGGRFQNILGNRMDDKKRTRVTQGRSLNEELMMRMPSITTNDPQPTWLHPDGIVGGPAFLRITREDMVLAKYYKPPSEFQLTENQPEAIRQASAEKHTKEKDDRAKLARSRLKRSADHSDVSLTHSFTGVTFTDCECSLILMTLYTKLVEHCRKAEDIPTLIDALLEFATVCITSSNIPQMMRLIDEALLLLSKQNQDKKKDENKDDEKDVIPAWKYPFVMGRIHTLLGYSHLILNQNENAYKRLYLAMEEFGEPFPVTPFRAYLQCSLKKTKLKFLLRYLPQVYVGRLTGFKAAIAEHMAECLSLLCIVFQVKLQWNLAYLAACWGLTVSLQTKYDFYGLCAAFCNMLNIANHFSDDHMSWSLETSALTLCNLTTCSEAKELEAIVKLYFAVFNSRLNRGEIRHAGNLGLKLLHITSNIQTNDVRKALLPTLILTMVIERRINQAVLLLHTLELAAKGEMDKSALAWFLALSVRVQLETGFSVVTIDQVEKFLLEEGEDLTAVRDNSAKTRFFINAWIWCLRNSEWEAADTWSPLALRGHLHHTDDSMAAVFSSINLLEGLLLLAVGRVDVRDVKTVAARFKEIHELIEKIGKATKAIKMAVPRYLHMKAYYHQIRYHDKSGLKILAQGKKIAEEQGNLMEWSWMDHSEKTWNGTLPPFLMNLWLDRCEQGNTVDWNEGDEESKLSPYSLPLPKYINKI